MIHDAFEEGSSTEARRRFDALKGEVTGISARDAGLAAIGALTLATVERVNEIRNDKDVVGERAFAGIGKEAAATGVKLYVSDAQKRLKKLSSLIAAFNG